MFIFCQLPLWFVILKAQYIHMNFLIKPTRWPHYLIITCANLTLSTWFSSQVYADVYVDLQSPDEIIISTQMIDDPMAIRLEEPQFAAQYIQIKNPQQTQFLPYNDEVLLAAQTTHLEPAFIHAVIAAESQHNPHALSKKGASGLMQLMPATARRFHVLNKYDPQQNILAGSRYLRELSTLFKGDLNLTLAAYNAGPAAVLKYHGQIPPYIETLHYVPKVLKYYRHFSNKESS